MALGFRDCCNSASYFNVVGIPGSVSENEVYSIITLEGPIFCATYTNIPVLNYSVPTYHLIEMTMQDNTDGLGCSNCISENPCPEAQTIQISQFGPGSIATGTDCDIRTMYPMTVTCDITNPSFDGFADGSVRLVVTGGTYPYTFFSAGTNPAVYFGSANPDPNAPAPPDNTYVIIDGAAEGVYNITTIDAQADYVITTTCILDSPPAPLTLNLTANGTSLVGECDGQLAISVNGGTPPYEIVVNSVPTTETLLTGLCAGLYEVTVIDSGQDPNQQIVTQQVLITDPGAIVYPDNLCLTIAVLCYTNFNLDFQIQTGVLYNLRAVYECTNPEVLGLTTLLLRWEENVIVGGVSFTGWGIGLPFQTSNGNINFNDTCATPVVNQLVRFVKVDPQSQQPTGAYTADVGFLQGLTINLVEGICSVVGIGPGTPPGISGCTDPTANNYNPNATFDDGSCTYGGGGPTNPPLSFTLTVQQPPCGQQVGGVIISPIGGTGFYNFVVDGNTSIVPVVNLTVGTHTIYVIDSDGTQAPTQTITITEGAGTIVYMTITSAINTVSASYLQRAGLVGQNPAEGIGLGTNECQQGGERCLDFELTPAQLSYYRYPMEISINVSGLAAGQNLQGYFILNLKQHDVYSVGNPPCVMIEELFINDGFVPANINFISGVTPTGGINILNIGGVDYSINGGAPISSSDDTYVPRPAGINTQFIPNSLSANCPPLSSPPFPSGYSNLGEYLDLEFFNGGPGCSSNEIVPGTGSPNVTQIFDWVESVFNASRKKSYTYQIGSVSSPVTITNGTGTLQFQIRGRFRPFAESCPGAKAYQWEVEFVKTSPDLPCTSLNFQGNPYVTGTAKYLGSIKQVGNELYPQAITNIKIID